MKSDDGAMRARSKDCYVCNDPKSLIKIVLSTTSMLKSDHTGGYSRFSNSSFANLFFKIEWT